MVTSVESKVIFYPSHKKPHSQDLLIYLKGKKLAILIGLREMLFSQHSKHQITHNLKTIVKINHAHANTSLSSFELMKIRKRTF